MESDDEQRSPYTFTSDCDESHSYCCSSDSDDHNRNQSCYLSLILVRNTP